MCCAVVVMPGAGATDPADIRRRDDVQFRVYCFWNYGRPLGIFQVPRRKLIDIDEFGMTMEKCNRTGGWALKVFRVRKDGHYHFGAKINVIFAIEPGDPTLPPTLLSAGENGSGRH